MKSWTTITISVFSLVALAAMSCESSSGGNSAGTTGTTGGTTGGGGTDAGTTTGGTSDVATTTTGTGDAGGTTTGGTGGAGPTTGTDDTGSTTGTDDTGSTTGTDDTGGGTTAACPKEIICQDPTVESQITQPCGVGCLGKPADCASTCIESTVTGITSACAACYADSVNCGIKNCATKCLPPGTDICNQCLVDNNCRSAFWACAGQPDTICD